MARTTLFLKDEQWEKLEPLLLKTAPGKRGGRPWRDNRIGKTLFGPPPEVEDLGKRIKLRLKNPVSDS